MIIKLIGTEYNYIEELFDVIAKYFNGQPYEVDYDGTEFDGIRILNVVTDGFRFSIVCKRVGKKIRIQSID